MGTSSDNMLEPATIREYRGSGFILFLQMIKANEMLNVCHVDTYLEVMFGLSYQFS